MRARRAAVPAVCLIAAAMALSACGAESDDDKKAAGKTLTIYSSLPLAGPDAARARSIVNGMKLAVAEQKNRAGEFKIRYVSLDDAKVEDDGKSEGWDPERASANARRAKDDKATIAYLGELDSEATAISLPLLNDDGIPQVSPGNSAVGLTSDAPGAARGEPDKYYPKEQRSYARVVPNDSVQAAALTKVTAERGCKRIAVIDDRSVPGTSLARALEQAAKRARVQIAYDDSYDSRDEDYRRLGEDTAKARPDCVVLAAESSNNAARAASDLAAALPAAQLFAGASLADPLFVDSRQGGVADPVARRLAITLPALGQGEYPKLGRQFFRDYESRYGSAPDPYAIYGYEAMKMTLEAIAKAGADGNDRDAVNAALRATRNRDGAVGTYSIDSNGDTTLTDYGAWRVEDGKLVFDEAIEVGRVRPPPQSAR